MASPELVTKVENPINFPKSVQFLIERHCLLRCNFCDQSCSGQMVATSHHIRDEKTGLAEFVAGRRKREGKLLGGIDSIADMGVEKVTFTGGDPILVNSIVDLLIRAKSRGMKTALATGWPGISYPEGMEPRFLPRVAPYLDTLKLSIHGWGFTHDNIVGLKGAFGGMYCALMESRRFSYDKEVTFVVCEENVKEISPVLDLCLGAGVSRFTLSVVWPRGRGKDVRQIPAGEVEEMRQRLLEEKGDEIKSKGLTLVVRKPELSCILVYPEGDVFASYYPSPSGLYRIGNLFADNLISRWKEFPLKDEFQKNYERLN